MRLMNSGFKNCEHGKYRKKIIYGLISLMIIEAKILMGEIDAENAFDNSKSFYDICFHKVGIKNSFIMVKFIYQIPKENIIFN